MIEGYKGFNFDFTNRYGKKFQTGKIYKANGNIEFKKNGFHMCTNLEDIFRYFDAINDEIIICKVKGNGKVSSYNDEYNGYYDMYCVEEIEIIKQLTREEIIEIGLNLNDFRVIRFIKGYKLTNEEIEQFKTTFKDWNHVLKAISYYQEGNKQVYEQNYLKLTKRKRL